MALMGQADVWEIFTLSPDAIKIPKDYGRIDLGDLEELAASIERFGLLSPILVHVDDEGEYVLRSGLRRLRACADVLGWKVVPLLAVDHLHDTHDAAARAFGDENTLRKGLTPSEAVRLADVIQARVQAAMRTRGRNRVEASMGLGGMGEGRVQSRDVAARAVGLSATTLRSARQLLNLAADPRLEEETRAGVREKVEFMDATGNVSRALREARALVAPASSEVAPVRVPSLRSAWARAGEATASFAAALDTAADALSRETPGLGAEINDVDLDLVETNARRALELVRQVRKTRLKVVGS